MANTYFGSKLTNKLSTESPRQFLDKLGQAAVRARTGGKAPVVEGGFAACMGGGLAKAWSAASSLADSLHLSPASLVAAAGGYAAVTLVRHLRRGDGGGEGAGDHLTPGARAL